MDAAWIVEDRGVESEALDEEAVVRASQQNREAFGPLYDRYVTGIYRYIRSQSVSDDEAADLTQQVFLRALAGLGSYQSRGRPFASWLFRIARNLIIDARRQRRITMQWDSLPELLQGGCGDDAECLALRREEIKRLLELVNDLRPEHRELLILRFVVGLSAREAAAVLGKREAATHKQLARILRTLKGQYDVE